jgi:hypothetical protein
VPMAGELVEPIVTESREIVVHEIGGPSREHGHTGVAILLTVAAIVAALIGVGAALTSSAASESWQSALRTEVKRSAGAMDDVRYMYQAELPIAIRIVEARIVESELLAASQGASGATKQALLMEASVQAQIVSALAPSSVMATTAEYTLASGGLDLGKRLAALRAQSPSLLALDPDGLEATGDRLANKAELLMTALLPTSAAAFLGVLAQPFKRRRLLLLRLGSVALAGGAVMALAVFFEVLA